MPNFSFLGCLEGVVLWLETNKKQDNYVELEASLAPAEAEVGAVAKADQKVNHRWKKTLCWQIVLRGSEEPPGLED